jgi:MerR family transcriptional regulator, redox-sensitive transcriptional activator SoxR
MGPTLELKVSSKSRVEATLDDHTPLTIGELAKRSRTPATTIRYYEREELLPAPARLNGRRRYDHEAEQRLAAIALAKQAGFSLREIKRFMNGFSLSTPPSLRWRAMATAKLDELDRRAEEIERMRSVLRLGLECDCLTFDQCELLQN